MKKKTFLVSFASLALLFEYPYISQEEYEPKIIENSKKNTITNVASSFDGQTKTSGTSESNPLVIRNESQYLLFLNNLQSDKAKTTLNDETSVTWATAYYKLADDIDMSLINADVKPIFSEDVASNPKDYNLHIDGDNHEIRNYSFNDSSIFYSDTTNEASCGVFNIFRGEVKDLSITYSQYKINVPGRKENFGLAVGGFAGITIQANLTNVHVNYNCDLSVNYSVTGDAYNGNSYYTIGGIVGYVGIQSSIINCSATCADKSFTMVSNSLQGYVGCICGVLKHSLLVNSFAYINKFTVNSIRETSSETYLGLTNGAVYDSVVQNVYSHVNSKESKNSSLVEVGKATYLGVIFGDASIFERIFIYDPTGTDARGNKIEESVLFSDIKHASAGVPVFLNNPFNYDTDKTCNYYYGFTVTNDTEVDTTKTYYTRAEIVGAQAYGEALYSYTKVDSPVKEDITSYYEEKLDTICEFKSQSVPFTYDGRNKRQLNVALDNFVTSIDEVKYLYQGAERTSLLNGWYYSQTSNSGITYMPLRYQGRIFSITYAEGSRPYSIEGGTRFTSYEYGVGVTELPSTVIMDGYTFEGWYTSSTFGGNPVTSIADDAIGDIVLYAKFVENKKVAPLWVWILVGTLILLWIGAIIGGAIGVHKYRNTYHKPKKKDNGNSPF